MQEKNLVNVKKILLDLADYLKVKGIRGLAQDLGENENKLYGWIKNGNIGDTGSILGKYPFINLHWLKTGEGEMIQRTAAEAKEQINETHDYYRPDMTPTDKVLLNSVTDKIFDRYFRQESAEKKHNFIDRLLKELEEKE